MAGWSSTATSESLPLEPLELRLLGELLATRAAVTITISSWRAARGLEEPVFATRYNASVAETIETILTVGWDETARRFGAEVPWAASIPTLVARRGAALGPALETLSYDEPIRMVEASGVWMTDVDGRRYLDAYNNVPVVGHGHPRVTEAIARQARRLNTNLRYLHDTSIELAERLIATCPPGLDTVFFVNSGSEANDLAWRLATTATGRRGGLCTDFAYHGISEAIAAVTPETWPGGRAPEHVATWTPPDLRRGTDLDGAGFSAAIATLESRGIPPAAVILDGLLTSDGYPSVDPDLAETWLGAAHRAGALWIADEVQGGHGRTGTDLWSFEHLGLIPDIVTIGKPMGNGHPVGAVITRREIAEAFADETVFFSTFGGNPVAMAAALAVLDVIDDERIVARAANTGRALQNAIAAATRGRPGCRRRPRGGHGDRDRMRRCGDGALDQGGAAGPRRAGRHERTGWQRPQGPAAAGVHDCRGADPGRGAGHDAAGAPRLTVSPGAGALGGGPRTRPGRCRPGPGAT